MNVYQLPALAAARQSLENLKQKHGALQAGVQAGLGQTKELGLVALGSYGASRLSHHLGGPEGKKIGGIPLELALGGAAAVVAMTGYAGEYSDELLHLGIGAVAGFAAKKGAEAGLKTTKAGAPPAVAGYPAGYFGAPGTEVGASPEEEALNAFARQPA
jgi:hypothetical protein